MSPITPGSAISARELIAVSGAPVAIPDPGHLVHLQFRRFAGGPLCNLHLRSVVSRNNEVEAAGVREVVVFHSPATELAEHTADLPFPVIADPGKRLHVEFGVESAPRALLSPRVWIPVIRRVTRSLWQIARNRERGPANTPHRGRLGLPADFLIAPDGHVVAAKYGEHAYNQWSVDELLELASPPTATDLDHRVSPLA